MKQRLVTLANALAVFAALLVLWQLILWIFHVPRYMLPSPWAVARAVVAALPVAADLARDHGGRVSRRAHRQHRGRRGRSRCFSRNRAGCARCCIRTRCCCRRCRSSPSRR